MRVLLVDDDPEFRGELTMNFRDHGHTSMVLTGSPTVETVVRSLQLGALDYVRKPASPPQGDRVLALVHRQLALTRTGARALHPGKYASELATEGGNEVFLIAAPLVRVTAKQVSDLTLDSDNPSSIRSSMDEFVVPNGRSAVVLAAVEKLLARHREEDIAALLEEIRELLMGKGPLAVGYDPNKITTTGALAVRASIVSADAHPGVESLSNPIRRLVLDRLAEGPCSFTQAMEAANLDDTSLIAFHLRKLSESGLMTHLARERYRLTPRGRGVTKILKSIDELDSAEISGNRVFPSTTPKTIAS
jgi:CheY-like chemotaxis protein/predicted transcriptional regulator